MEGERGVKADKMEEDRGGKERERRRMEERGGKKKNSQGRSKTKQDKGNYEDEGEDASRLKRLEAEGKGSREGKRNWEGKGE